MTDINSTISIKLKVNRINNALKKAEIIRLKNEIGFNILSMEDIL